MYIKVDFDKLKEECGVVGVYSNDYTEAVARTVYYGLYALQHRGQESAGIATYDGEKTSFHKEMGLVPEIFTEGVFDRLSGYIGIGHVRYSTTGESHIRNAQPLVVGYRGGSIALAHNGNLVNAAELRRSLEDEGVVFQTTIDSEVIVNLIARYSNEGITPAIRKTMEIIKGAYALVVMTEEYLVGVRDPYGLRPLCLGRLKEGYILASESCGIDAMGAEFIRDVEPGEMIIINGEGYTSAKVKTEEKTSSCSFEYIYFARPDSIIDGISVYEARKTAGRILAKEHPIEADLVIPVPDTSIPAAIGFAEVSGIPYGEGLIKNRYVGRTFIQPDQGQRQSTVKLKLNSLKHTVAGKRIIMIDDSIVRGTTSGQIVNSLKLAGAKEVHVRISSPPVSYGCHFGIDTPNRSQLIGATRTVEEIRQAIGADSLGYISIEGLTESLGRGKGCHCLACFNGNYPMEVPETGNKNILEATGGKDYA